MRGDSHDEQCWVPTHLLTPNYAENFIPPKMYRAQVEREAQEGTLDILFMFTFTAFNYINV